MKWGEAFEFLLDDKQLVNTDWNGLRLEGKIMYIAIEYPKEGSIKFTEPCFMMYVGTYKGITPKGGWEFKRFSWMPSVLDLFSENWSVR